MANRQKTTVVSAATKINGLYTMAENRHKVPFRIGYVLFLLFVIL